MARHDDGKRISAEGLSDSPCRTSDTKSLRNLPVGERLSRRYRARYIVDASIERRHTLHIQHDSRKIAPLSSKVSGNGIDRVLDSTRRRHFASRWKAREQPRSGVRGVRLR
jgi:hypothetical protein